MFETGCCLFSLFVWGFGIFSFVQICIAVAQMINRHLIRRPLDLAERYGKGSWAVVTGATGGIGEEFCKQLAEKGFNIALMSRDKAKLEASEKLVKLSYPKIQTRIVQADFSESMTPDFYQNIYRQLEDLDISILVNNAGIAYFNYFAMISAQEIKDMIQTNCCSYLYLAHSLAKKLMNREKRGAIINIDSIAGLSPLPLQGGYCGTKRFVRFLSYMLYNMFSANIDVLNINPGFVSTKLVFNREGFDHCTAEICVSKSLRDLGYDLESSPFWIHNIQYHVVQQAYRFLTPVWLNGTKQTIEKVILEEFYKKHSNKK